MLTRDVTHVPAREIDCPTVIVRHDLRIYGCAMSPDPHAASPIVIDGRVGRKTSNGLKMTFQEGEGDPLAVAVQSSGDGKGAKLGMLFGFKNGGPGKQV